MAKKRSNAQKLYPLIFVGLLFFWVLSVFFGGQGTFLEERSQAKPSMWAGYVDLDSIDYRLEVFTDSTFQLYSKNNKIADQYRIVNDTLFLLQHQKVCAKLFENQLLNIQCPSFDILSKNGIEIL